MFERFTIGIVGATGLVGQAFISQLSDTPFFIKAFASAESVGRVIRYKNQDINVQALLLPELKSCNLVIFAGDVTSATEMIPVLAAQGIPCIDKTGVFRMDERVHLCVPSVNGLDQKKFSAFPVVASPNCCVVPLTMVLFPLYHRFGLDRVVISTYQSLSGGGRQVLEQAQQDQAAGLAPQLSPYIGTLVDADGDTDEECKIRSELRKILKDFLLPISVTSVRVPAVVGHGISVTVFFKTPCLDRLSFEALFQNTEQVHVLHEQKGGKAQDFPLASVREIAGSCDVCVARLRSQQSDGLVWSFWLMSDNLVTGAAYNAKKILESIIHATF